MTKEELCEIFKEIHKPDKNAYDEARRRWDNIAKPLDGLGDFEDIIKKIAGITRSADIDISKRAVLIMCADNGVVKEGISQSGSEVTSVVALNMARGIASVCKMAHLAGVHVIPVDIGISGNVNVSGLIKIKLAKGTKNFAKEPAMAEDELVRAIKTGIRFVGDMKDKGYKIIATGEMGIGNTTTSSALASILLKLPVNEVTGRGAGLDRSGMKKKILVIENAIQKYDLRKKDAWEALRCVGGLDIAGLTGVFIGGVVYHVPIVIDGVISAVAALISERLVSGSKDYMIASHMGKEPACRLILKELGLKAVIDANMALGEGTGAVMLFPLLDMALSVYNSATTFEEINVSRYVRHEI